MGTSQPTDANARNAPALWRYGVAVLATTVAFAGTLAVGRLIDMPTDVLFAGAVALSAWYGGRGAGMLSGLLAVIGIDYADLPPIGRVELSHPEEALHFGVFLLVVLIISSTTEALRRARAVSELRAKELADANARLAQQMEEVKQLSEELQTANESLLDSRDEAERIASRASALQQVTAALSDAATVADVGNVVAGTALDTVQAVRGYLGVLSGDGKMIEMVATWGVEPDVEAQRRAIAVSDEYPVSHAVRTGEPLWFGSIEELRVRFPLAIAPVAPAAPHRTHAALPLVHRGEVIGGLALYFDEPTATGVVDRAFTNLLAQATAAALHRARTYDAERERRREAELLARGREEVLGVVAHDLRNPLSLIGTTAQFLEEEYTDEERRKQLFGVLHRGVAQMNRLIGDLLDTVQLQTGHLSLHLERVPVRDILRQMEETFEPAAAERHITLRTVCPNDGEIEADTGRVVQALGNLVGNALKFTPSGGTVMLRARVPDDRREVRFEVADDGPGIPPENLDRIFDRFWQARKGDRRGVGLGLAIAKGIVEAHGGRIEVRSTVGAGSTFAVTLPANHERERAAAERRRSSMSAGTSTGTGTSTSTSAELR